MSPVWKMKYDGIRRNHTRQDHERHGHEPDQRGLRAPEELPVGRRAPCRRAPTRSAKAAPTTDTTVSASAVATE